MDLNRQAGRKGTQIHTTNIRPFADVKHRCYFIARDANDKVRGISMVFFFFEN